MEVDASEIEAEIGGRAVQLNASMCRSASDTVPTRCQQGRKDEPVGSALSGQMHMLPLVRFKP